jgi:hypothetical protein
LPVDTNSDVNRKKPSAKYVKDRSAWPPMGIERDPDPDLEQCSRADADDLASHQAPGADGTHHQFRDAARVTGNPTHVLWLSQGRSKGACGATNLRCGRPRSKAGVWSRSRRARRPGGGPAGAVHGRREGGRVGRSRCRRMATRACTGMRAWKSASGARPPTRSERLRCS